MVFYQIILKKEIRSYFQKNTVSQSPNNKDDIYGCESKGIIQVDIVD